MTSLDSLQIRRAGLTDLERIAVIEAESFSDPWPPPLLLEEMERDQQSGGFWVAAQAPHGIVGFVSLRTLVDELEILNVAVTPARRGAGIGKRLVEFAMELAADWGLSRVILEVRESNRTARRLYKDLGFVVVGSRVGYYRNPPEDAVLYTLDL